MTEAIYTPDTKKRLEVLEEAMRTIWALLSNAISKDQFNRLNSIRQKEHTLLETRVSSLETTLQSLQTQIDDLL